MNLYQVLGVPTDVSAKEIKAAYKKLAQRWHPDREGGDREIFSEVAQAFAILSDDKKRARYDKTGETSNANSIEKRAESAVMNFASMVFERKDHCDDYVAAIGHEIFKARKEMLEQVGNISDRLGKLERMRDRFSATTEENILVMLVESKIEEAKRSLEQGKEEVKVASYAAELIGMYSDNGGLAGMLSGAGGRS